MVNSMTIKGVCGKLLRILVSMYSTIKSYVRTCSPDKTLSDKP